MKILIVEDDDKIRAFLKDSLESEFFAVDAVSDGETGSYCGRTNEYDLVILDNQLPKKNGIDVCREIRDNGKTMPILILSVRSETVTKTQLLDAGADDYLTKPFELAELLARVRALLRRPLAIEAEILQVKDIELDVRRSVVKKREKPIKLTRKEFMLLQYLMQNRGTVLSRGMILEHVWDMSADIFSNTIESHILSLRKKIGDTDSKRRLIETVPGRGYKIDI